MNSGNFHKQVSMYDLIAHFHIQMTLQISKNKLMTSVHSNFQYSDS